MPMHSAVNLVRTANRSSQLVIRVPNKGKALDHHNMTDVISLGRPSYEHHYCTDHFISDDTHYLSCICGWRIKDRGFAAGCLRFATHLVATFNPATQKHQWSHAQSGNMHSVFCEC